MRKLLFTVIAFVITGCSSEIINMDTAKNEVRNYYESGTYSKELKQVIDKTLEQLSDIELAEKTAVVFDVDDTVLSSYKYTNGIGFGFEYPTWKKFMLEGKLSAIPEVKKLYDWLIEKNIHIIFLTGRRSDECDATYDNLVKEGFSSFDTLICRPANVPKNNAAEFKPSVRKELTQNGYKIVACLGDQWSDLSGDFTGIKVKLPNYLYLID